MHPVALWRRCGVSAATSRACGADGLELKADRGRPGRLKAVHHPPRTPLSQSEVDRPIVEPEIRRIAADNSFKSFEKFLCLRHVA
jgi:hypothetical protein